MGGFMVCPRKALKVSTLSDFLKFSLVSHCELEDTSITPIESAIFAGNHVGLYKVGLWYPYSSILPAISCLLCSYQSGTMIKFLPLNILGVSPLK